MEMATRTAFAVWHNPIFPFSTMKNHLMGPARSSIAAAAMGTLAAVAAAFALLVAIPFVSDHILGGHLLAIVPAALTGLRSKKDRLMAEARTILERAERSGKLTDGEQKHVDGLLAEIDQLNATITRTQTLNDLGDVPSLRGYLGGQGARAGVDRASGAKMANNVLQMLRGMMNRSAEIVNKAQRELAREGFYGPEAQQRAAGDYYSTLVDADGAALLPTVVVDGIESIAEVVGVARQLVTVYPHTTGILKVPGATGQLRPVAVAEGVAITSKMRAFRTVSLNPEKWALIVPMTFEANLEAGPRILADVQMAIAEGYAYVEDNALFNGDGTGTYHGIDGILSANRSGVEEYILPATKTSFEDLSSDDVLLLRRKIPPSLRARGVYAFHPDMEPVLHTLKDASGRYLFSYNETSGIPRLGSRPVVYTEVLPGIDADDVETTFGVFGDFRAFKMAVGGETSAEEMREGSITDADTGTAINLATQDMRALKIRRFFEMDTNFEEAFVKITTAAEEGEGE